MTVVELLGTLDEKQDYIIVTGDKHHEHLDVKTCAEHDVKVLGIKAVRENLIKIETNFSWYI